MVPINNLYTPALISPYTAPILPICIALIIHFTTISEV